MCVGKHAGPRLAGMILLGIVCAIGLARPLGAAPPASQEEHSLEADILLGAARNAVHRGDLKTAIERFADFRKRYPNQEQGRREYADALFRAGRVREAMPEYEWLLSRHPNDPQLVRSIVDAMLATGDHPRAKARLTDALVRFPGRVDFALSLALLHALDQETVQAQQLLERSILGRPLPTKRMQLDAATLLVQLRHAKDAEPMVESLLKNDPDDARVLAVAVRYALLVGDPHRALRYADRLERLYPGNIDLRLEIASSLYSAGDYAEAGKLFDDVLRKSPKNHTALLGSARVALQDYRVDRADAQLDQIPDDLRGRSWYLALAERDTIAGDYLRAQKTLVRLIAENASDRRASIALADLDRARNEFLKADARYQAEGATADNTPAARQYALSLYLQRRYAPAEELVRRLVALDPTDSGAMVLLARILVKTHRDAEAASWLGKSQEGAGHAAAECPYFRHVLSQVPSDREPDDSRPIYLAVVWFDLAMEDGRQACAKEALDRALAADPDNLVLQTRLAQWHASFGTPDQAMAAAAVYKRLLTHEPSNHKWLLGLARALVTMRCYDDALAIYRRLRCETPDNYLYAREMARVVFVAYGSPKGLAVYDEAVSQWPGMPEEARRLCKERFAKACQSSAPGSAATAYCELLVEEPYEPYLAFELGQVHGALGATTDAIGAYQYLLSVQPNHREAQIALEGKRLEQLAEIQVQSRFVRERGRDGLTSIDRLGDYVTYQMPRSDKTEHLTVGYGRLSLAPTAGAGTTGDALVVNFQRALEADWGSWFSPYAPVVAFVDCELQHYDRYVSTRPVFEAGFRLRSANDLVWTISGTMESVLENSESLEQDVYRGGLHAGLDYMPTNAWTTQVQYDFQQYSDENTSHTLGWHNRLSLTPDPRRISLLADCDYSDFAEASVFGAGPDPLSDMLHPYWTPQDYLIGSVGVEWKQWLSWDRFDGAQNAWVAFSVKKRWDNQDQNYIVYRGTLGWDITRRLAGSAVGEYTDGAAYRGVGVSAGLNWRF